MWGAIMQAFADCAAKPICLIWLVMLQMWRLSTHMSLFLNSQEYILGLKIIKMKKNLRLFSY